MSERIAEKIVRSSGAFFEGHYRGTEGRHFDGYFESDLLSAEPERLSTLCMILARHFAKHQIQAVVAPALGGIALSQSVVLNLQIVMKRKDLKGKVKALYVKKKGKDFVFPDYFVPFIEGKRILAIDDAITTGGSLKKVIEEAKKLGGNVVAAGALWNSSGIKAANLGVVELFSVMNRIRPTWSPEECPRCQQGISIVNG